MSRWTRVREYLKLALIAAIGAGLALAFLGHMRTKIGPFETTASARLSTSGHTTVDVAPLGTIDLDTHAGPLALDIRVDELRLADAQRIAQNPQSLDTLGKDIESDVRRTLVVLAVRSCLIAAVGGALGAAAALAHPKSLLLGALSGLVLWLAVGGVAAATFDRKAVSEPRYTGLLSVAPRAVGDVQTILDRFGQYRQQLADLIGNMVNLYVAGQGLPTFQPQGDTIRILQVSDIHLNPQAFDLIELVVRQFDVDAIADTGDITDWGSEPENQLLARIGRLGIPYVWVRGNHDSGTTQAAVAAQPNAVVLDASAATVAGLRFWGIGDPRYTPNKDQPTGTDVERDQALAFAPTVRRDLIADEPPAVDVVMVHDERAADRLGGRVPLVLAGHTHVPREGDIGDTKLLVEGTTGGAGLRALRGEEPQPLSCSVLYFDPATHRLLAYDQLIVSGLGGTNAKIERHIIGP